MRRMIAAAATALVSSAFLPLPRAHAAGPTVTGSGSTWSQVAVDQWRADVSRYGIKINYQGVGSSAGRQNFINNTTDFAVSEIPFEPNEIQAVKDAGRNYVYLPIVAGGTSLMYNLKDAAGKPVRDLRLSSNTIAKIFTRKITNWSDAQITSDNGGRQLPSRNIVPVARSDGSGTTAQFTTYLLKRENDVWCPFATANGINPCTYTSNYPAADGFVLQSGSDGVANYVHNEGTGAGAITYVETAYALQRGRPVAAVKNASGNYALPTSKNVSIALTKAELNADRTQKLDKVYVHTDPNTYPISSYSYMIAPTKGFPAAKGEVLGKFILYFACTGQRKADQLGYAPLPRNLVQVVFDAEQKIPGAPTPPAIKKCDNPTIQGGTGSVSDSTGDQLSSGGSGGVVKPDTPAGGGGGGGGGGSGSSGSGGAGTATTGGTTSSGGGGSSGGASAGGDATVTESSGDYVGGDSVGGGVANQALPKLDLSTKALSWLPFVFAGALVLLVIFVPPAFAFVGAGSSRRRRDGSAVAPLTSCSRCLRMFLPDETVCLDCGTSRPAPA